MNKSINSLSDIDVSKSSSVQQDIFRGLCPPSHSTSVLNTSLPSFEILPLFYSNMETSILPATTNNNDDNNSNVQVPRPLQRHSTPSMSLNTVTNQSNRLSSSTFSKLSYNITKPASFFQKHSNEKLEMSALNDKFADYVEKVRYLEAHNKKLQMDANLLSEKQGEHYLKLKTVFEREVAHMKEAVELLSKKKNKISATAVESKNAIPLLKQRLNETFNERDSSQLDVGKIEKQLSSIDGDILMYNRRLAHHDKEQIKWKQFITQIQRLLIQGRNEIHNEIFARNSCEQTIQQLRAEITRLNEQQPQNLHSLKQSSFVLSSNSTNERARTFKSELSTAIRKIRQDCEKENEVQRNELYQKFAAAYEDIIREYPASGFLFLSKHEQQSIREEEAFVRKEIQRAQEHNDLIRQKNAALKLRVRELQINMEITEADNKRIQQAQQYQMNQWKSKQEKMAQDYESLISKQASLRQEIEAYRNLLEGTMKPVVDHITDEYKAMTANQIKREQIKGIFNRRGASTSVDRLSARPTTPNTDEINSFRSHFTWNPNNDPSKNLRKSTSHNSTSMQSVGKSKSITDVSSRMDTNDQQVLKRNETVNGENSTNARSPIVLETGRKK